MALSAWAWLVCAFTHRKHYIVVLCETIPHGGHWTDFKCTKCGAEWYEVAE